MNKGKILGLIAEYHAFPAQGCGITWVDHCPGMLLGKPLGKRREEIDPSFIAAQLLIPREEASILFWFRGGNYSLFDLLPLTQQKAYIVGVLESLLETGHVVFPAFELIPRSVS